MLTKLFLIVYMTMMVAAMLVYYVMPMLPRPTATTATPAVTPALVASRLRCPRFDVDRRCAG